MPLREVLPARRRAETFDMKFGGQNTEFSITTGFYDDGRLGEVFITGAKAGSEMASLTHDGAILISLALQHGTQLATIKYAVSRNANGSAASIIGAVVDRIMERQS
jgi:hypothetical protein